MSLVGKRSLNLICRIYELEKTTLTKDLSLYKKLHRLQQHAHYVELHLDIYKKLHKFWISDVDVSSEYRYLDRIHHEIFETQEELHKLK